MRKRNVYLASVCAAFLAASAAVAGPAAAAKASNPNTDLASSAYKALAAGDPATAIAQYTTAIESRSLEPEVLANALLNRALAYQRLNQHDLAVADYTAALRIDAMSAKLRAMALYNRGLSFQRLEQPSRAIEDFTSALFLDQEFAYAYYSRGMVLRESGQYLFALGDFEKALQFNYPDPARVYFGEALAYDGLKRPADARTALTAALTANPQFEPAKVRLAALDGHVPAPPKANASDGLTTSSIAGETVLPKAQAPSFQAVAAADAATVVSPKPHKRFYDRVPIETAAAGPTKAGKNIEIQPVSDTPEETPDAAGDTLAVAAAQPADGSAPDAEAQAPSQTTGDTTAADAADGSTDDAAKVSGWAVQVASAQSEQGAWSTYKNIQSRHAILANQKPIVVKADLGSKGTFFRVRFVGFDDQGAAQAACAKFKSSGVSCFISKADS